MLDTKGIQLFIKTKKKARQPGHDEVTLLEAVALLLQQHGWPTEIQQEIQVPGASKAVELLAKPVVFNDGRIAYMGLSKIIINGEPCTFSTRIFTPLNSTVRPGAAKVGTGKAKQRLVKRTPEPTPR